MSVLELRGLHVTYRSVRGDVPAAIRRIGERIGANEGTIDRCIADLPAVEL